MRRKLLRRTIFRESFMSLNLRHAWAGLAWAVTGLTGFTAHAADLPQLNIDLQQTTVSGISSGAFMAVQMAVAKSASVRGVAVTAGGPYNCALDAANGYLVVAGAGSMTSIARCMQGDPSLPAQPITDDQLAQMVSTTTAWAQKGKIDPVSNLANQAVWVFHGYNDGIVKLPVSQALLQWYGNFAPTTQIFAKDTLNAAHAQISAACGDTRAASCNLCPTVGNQFINTCTDQPQPSAPVVYDAAGSALQMFYGPLKRTATSQLSATAQEFSQRPYLKWHSGLSVAMSSQIAMGDTGYVYVPQACKDGQSCRLHIAFHGCMQSATSIKRAFVDGAGVNEWADANRMVVLYPQATPTNMPVVNPMGCWDWWGYNDIPQIATFMIPNPVGTFATSEGVQIAAVWRMAEHLAAKGKPGTWATPVTPVPQLQALDQSDDQVLLRWQPVSAASGYRIYRSSGSDAPQAVGGVVTQAFWADSGLQAQHSYRYTVRAVVNGQESPDSNAVTVSTARLAPTLAQCNPYFSLALNKPVTAQGVPTTNVCP